jgi:thioredoxin reductase
MINKYEVVIIGGGPAGLSAALTLGRARRRVLILDHRKYRNSASRGLHGFLTRENIPPLEFLDIARSELKPYPSVELVYDEALDAAKSDEGFIIESKKHGSIAARKLILATGVVDILPPFPGARDFLGKGLYHCPYCDGWEHQNKSIAVYGNTEEDGPEFALMLTNWTRQVTLCTDGFRELSEDSRELLRKRNVAIREEPIARVEGDDSELSQVIFEHGEPLPCAAMFFNTTRKQSSSIALSLGCTEYDVKGCELTSKSGQTSIPGLYIAGDASKDFLQVIVAAAEGTEAAIAINKELMRDDGIIGVMKPIEERRYGNAGRS